jgi:ankyrin repeat protein
VLEQGVRPDTRAAHDGPTPLHVLCSGRDSDGDRVACFKLLDEAGANLDATDLGGRTPLHFAFNKTHSLVPILIEAGANVNVACSWNRITPLHNAAKFANVKIAIALLRAGAEVNVYDSVGNSPLHYAAACHNRHVRAALLRAGADITRVSNTSDPYICRVRTAGGFKEYKQAHLARVTRTFASKFRLPAQPARRVAEFWLHAGCY